MKKRRIIPLLLAALMLTACSAPSEPAPEAVLSGGDTAPVVSSADIDAAPVIPEAQHLSDGSAGGNIAFYVNDAPVFAGMNLSLALTGDTRCPDDLDLLLEPGQFSRILRLEYPSEEGSITLFAVVTNTFDQPTAVRYCTVYSISVYDGCAAQIGEGRLVSGKSKVSDVIDTYGEPTQRTSGEDSDILVYHSPLSTLSFISHNGVVRQVTAYHIADRYQNEISACSGLAAEDIPTAEGLTVLSRFLDVSSYAAGQSGPYQKLDTAFQAYGTTIELGCHSEDLPLAVAEKYINLWCPTTPHKTIRVGLTNEVEFQFFNYTSKAELKLGGMIIQGAYLLNPAYGNFGVDNSAHQTFSYMGLTNEDGIERILDTVGLPTEISATCDGRHGYAWLHYIAENGDTADFKVDIFTGELIELRVIKYYENATWY